MVWVPRKRQIHSHRLGDVRHTDIVWILNCVCKISNATEWKASLHIVLQKRSTCLWTILLCYPSLNLISLIVVRKCYALPQSDQLQRNWPMPILNRIVLHYLIRIFWSVRPNKICIAIMFIITMSSNTSLFLLTGKINSKVSDECTSMAIHAINIKRNQFK